jgi:rod shape-determining protein MreC
LSERLRAWYLLLALGFLTLLLLSFLGRAPASLSSAVALPHRLVYTASTNLRGFLEGGRERRVLLDEVFRLDGELAAARARIRDLELENARYARTLDLRASQSPGVVLSAPVVSASVSPVGGGLELGLGGAAGVLPDMPVTVADGLVGVVSRVGERSAWVTTVLDPSLNVGVSVRGRGGQGIARGEAGGVLRVSGYLEETPIRVGDTVETSSRGGLFPRGITVGRVVHVFPQDANALQREFLVRSSVELDNLLEVALIRPL